MFVRRAAALIERVELPVYGALGGLFVAAFAVDFASFSPALHPENYKYLPFYASSAPWSVELAKPFDVGAVEACLNRFRPLGHLLELLDAKFLAAFAGGGGRGGFRSLSHLLFALGGAVALGAAIGRALPGLHRAHLVAFGGFFLSSWHVLVMNEVYFRPAKTVGAFATALLLGEWLRGRGRVTTSVGASVFWTLVFWATTLVDETPAFVLGALLVAALVERAGARVRNPFAARAACALLFFAISAAWIGPWTFGRFSSCVAIRPYSDPGSYLELSLPLLRDALRITASQVALFFGGFSEKSWVPVMSGVLILAAPLTRSGKAAGTVLPAPRWLSAFLFLAAVGMHYGMACRHRPILDLGVRETGYYYAASTLLVAAGLFLALGRWGALSTPPRRLGIAGALAVLACLNFGGVGARRTAQTGDASGLWARTEVIRRLLTEGTERDALGLSLPDEAREFVSRYRAVLKASDSGVSSGL